MRYIHSLRIRNKVALYLQNAQTRKYVMPTYFLHRNTTAIVAMDTNRMPTPAILPIIVTEKYANTALKMLQKNVGIIFFIAHIRHNPLQNNVLFWIGPRYNCPLSLH